MSECNIFRIPAAFIRNTSEGGKFSIFICLLHQTHKTRVTPALFSKFYDQIRRSMWSVCVCVCMHADFPFQRLDGIIGNETCFPQATSLVTDDDSDNFHIYCYASSCDDFILAQLLYVDCGRPVSCTFYIKPGNQRTAQEVFLSVCSAGASVHSF